MSFYTTETNKGSQGISIREWIRTHISLILKPMLIQLCLTQNKQGNKLSVLVTNGPNNV